jgi:hypothetical protein
VGTIASKDIPAMELKRKTPASRLGCGRISRYRPNGYHGGRQQSRGRATRNLIQSPPYFIVAYGLAARLAFAVHPLTSPNMIVRI